MLDVDQIRHMLQPMRLDIVSEATTLHRNTIAAIRSGATRKPSKKAIKALSDYLQNWKQCVDVSGE